MNNNIRRALCALLVAVAAVTAMQAQRYEAHVVSGFPSAEPGYSLGVSACFAGRVGKYIVMAGGCNFPVPGNTKDKHYYCGIYAARIDREALQWRIVGWLPEPAAYGVTVESGDSLLFIGGNNLKGSLSTVYSVALNADGDRAEVHRMADMPMTVDNMSVAACDGSVFVVGGNQNGKPGTAVLRLELASGRGWSVLSHMPGEPRVQPASVAHDGRIYVFGGFYANGGDSKVHTRCLSYDLGTGQWADLPAPRSVKGEEKTLSGGVAAVSGERAVALGGVNRDIFLDAISGRYAMVDKADYLNKPIAWYRFNPNLFVFDLKKGQWAKTLSSSPYFARAGAQMVVVDSDIYYIGGELKPALRTPVIVRIAAKK